MKKWACNYSIPFSAFHKYSREDSINMNKFCTPLNRHYVNFNNKIGEMLPAFITWDSNKELYKEINPEKNEENFEKPEIFGDN